MSKTKRNEYWEILNCLHEHNINPLTREVYLGGFPPSYEDDEIGVDHQMACEFIRNMTFLEHQSDDPIMIHQCTIGGDDAYGMAIYDKIKTSPCFVTVRAYAHARSMSSITIQGADKREMLGNCYYMIHHGTVHGIDTYKGVKSFMRLCDLSRDKMMEIYCERALSLTPDIIEAHLDKHQEWYMTAGEALGLGLIDEIIG